MNKLLLMFGIIDLAIGMLFGNIGYFYAILCFPLIAIVRGYLGINRLPRSYKSTFVSVFTGAAAFLIGLIIGMIILSTRISSTSRLSPLTQAAIGQGLIYSVLTGIVFFLLYIIFGMLSAYLCQEEHHQHKPHKEKENTHKRA